jgi:hypothetical protein
MSMIPIARCLAYWNYVLASVGALLIVFIVLNCWQGFESCWWKQALGTIIVSKTESICLPRAGWINGGRPLLVGEKAMIYYTYVVENHLYESYKIGDGPGAIGAETRYETGNRVKVYVNPRDSRDARIFPGIGVSALFSSLAYLIGGCLLIAVGLGSGSSSNGDNRKDT